MPLAAAAPAESSATEHLDAAAIFRQEFRYVWSSLRRLGVQQRDLEDTTHEVFVRVHDQLALFDESQPLRPWLFSLALGIAMNYRRLARHRLDLMAEPPDITDQAQRADDQLEQSEQAQLVHASLQKVPLEQCAVLVLHELDGFAIPEVAATLGLSLNTAYSRLRLGREAFRTAFRRLANQKGWR